VTIEPRTEAGRAGLDALLATPDRALIAFDYDGTLAGIVDDPMDARPGEGMVERLGELSSRVRLVAVVTGRPAQQAVDLAGFDSAPGLERLVVLGHYGVERWDAASSSLHTVDPPEGLDRVRATLPDLLASLDLHDADVEDKGLSVAVHVRRLADPAGAFSAMKGPLSDLAGASGLVAEPGRFVVELRPPGMDKGQALRTLADEVGAQTVVFTGDDLGDLPAFDEVARMRGEGSSGLLVCSGSAEVTALAEKADLVVDGPEGVAGLIDDLVAALPPL
jgi:trehalose 6-phosphate phosphatase